MKENRQSSKKPSRPVKEVDHKKNERTERTGWPDKGDKRGVGVTDTIPPPPPKKVRDEK